MNDFDKKLRKMVEETELPEAYNQRIDDTLQSLPEKNAFNIEKNKKSHGIVRVAVCVILVICILMIPARMTNANIFSEFKQTLMEFFHIGEDTASDDYGVESYRDGVVSKPDLFLELKEKIIDSHSIYLLVSITAPTDIEFTDEVGFDYFAFSEGSSFNADNLVGGSTECKLFEVKEDKPNVATFVVSLATSQEIAENTEMNVYFKDMMLDPYGENPQMLVEGIWSIAFMTTHTVSESKVVEGTEDMRFSHGAGTASLIKLELSSLGIQVEADVTEFHYADNAYSDAAPIALTLKMVDGTEFMITSNDPDEQWYVSSGDMSYNQSDGKEFQTDHYDFEEMIDISRVVGVYVEDLYVSLVE